MHNDAQCKKVSQSIALLKRAKQFVNPTMPECHGIWRNITEYGGISRNMPEYHGICRNITEYAGIS
jgi:hypothetical protein